MNVLITSASRKVALVEAFQSALAERAPGGGRVVAVDVNPLSPALFAADDRYLVPRSDSSDFVPRMLDLCRELDISVVVPTRDEELPLFAAQIEPFREAGVLVAVSSPETVDTCQDKIAFDRFCESRGFGVPRRYLESQLDGAAFPLFVKPRRGKGGAGATAVHDRKELDAALARLEDPIIQEMRRESEYTVDVFADANGRVISAVPRERVLVVAGESYVGRTLRDHTLMSTAVRLCEELRVFGHATVQCFYDGSEVLLIEVNPRYGGAANLGFAAGVPTPHYLIDIALHREVLPRLGEFRDGCTMLRFTQDMFFDDQELDVPRWE